MNFKFDQVYPQLKDPIQKIQISDKQRTKQNLTLVNKEKSDSNDKSTQNLLTEVNIKSQLPKHFIKNQESDIQSNHNTHDLNSKLNNVTNIIKTGNSPLYSNRIILPNIDTQRKTRFEDKKIPRNYSLERNNINTNVLKYTPNIQTNKSYNKSKSPNTSLSNTSTSVSNYMNIGIRDSSQKNKILPASVNLRHIMTQSNNQPNSIYMKQLKKDLKSDNMNEIQEYRAFKQLKEIKSNTLTSLNNYNLSLSITKSALLPKILPSRYKKQNPKFYFKIRNNHIVLKEVMSHRLNWQEGQNIQKSNFIWKYSSKKMLFRSFETDDHDKVKIFNHFEFHYEISNKKMLCMNIIEYCNANNINPFLYIPFTILLTRDRSALKRNQINFTEMFDSISNYVNSNEILDSDLNYELKYDRCFDTTAFNTKDLPNIPCYIPKDFLGYKNYWIVKPDNLCQGKLIKIFDNAEKLFKTCNIYFMGVNKQKQVDSDDEPKSNENENASPHKNLISLNPLMKFTSKASNTNNLTSKPKRNTMYYSSNILIQKYIERPLLFLGKKFDIRVFVLVDHLLNSYIFKEGHLRLCSEQYEPDSKKTFVHITNYSLQKKHPEFQKEFDGNEASFEDLQQFLDRETNSSINIYKDIMPKIKEMIKIALFSVRNKLNKRNVQYTFEIFGCDLILDRSYNPYLLEMNDNPGLSISSPLIARLIPRILDDAFRKTIDCIFNTEYKEECLVNGEYKSKYSLFSYPDSENLFEFMCNLN